MADFTLTSGQFPASTVVGVYARRTVIRETSGPIGAAITTATTSSAGTTAFTGLGYDTDYWAAASVGGTWRKVQFSTDPDPTTVALTQADIQAFQDALDAEATTRSDADTAEATARANAVSAEATTRGNADSALNVRLLLIEGPVVYLSAPSAVAATDTAAVVAANTALVAVGGGRIQAQPAPEADPYLLNDDVEISSAPPVNVSGASKDGTIFKLTTSGARLKFLAGGGGASSDFSVWGGPDRAGAIANVGIEVGVCNQRSFHNIDVRYTLQDGWLRVGTQNCAWHNCTAYDHAGNGWASDGESGANQHYNCGGSGCLDYAIEYRQTVALVPSIGLIQPSYDQWWGGVFERPWAGTFESPGTHANGLVNHRAGVHCTFHGTQFSLAGITSAMSVVTMSLDPSPATFSIELVLDDCEFSGEAEQDYATIARLTHAENTLRVRGRCVPAAFNTGFAVVDGARVYVETDAWDDDAAYVTTWAAKISGATPVEQLVQRNPKHHFGSKTWNPASLAVGFADTTNVTVQDAKVGDAVAVGFTQAIPAGFVLTGFVASAGLVTVYLQNVAGATTDVGSGDLRAHTWSH